MNTNNTSNPLFRVGQRVVAIKNHSQDVFKKGDVFTVTNILKTRCCNTWLITVGITHTTPLYSCRICGVDDQPIISAEWGFHARAFAPIEENKERIRYVAVSETLREKAEEVVVQSCNLS